MNRRRGFGSLKRRRKKERKKSLRLSRWHRVRGPTLLSWLFSLYRFSRLASWQISNCPFSFFPFFFFLYPFDKTFLVHWQQLVSFFFLFSLHNDPNLRISSIQLEFNYTIWHFYFTWENNFCLCLILIFGYLRYNWNSTMLYDTFTLHEKIIFVSAWS